MVDSRSKAGPFALFPWQNVFKSQACTADRGATMCLSILGHLIPWILYGGVMRVVAPRWVDRAARPTPENDIVRIQRITHRVRIHDEVHHIQHIAHHVRCPYPSPYRASMNVSRITPYKFYGNIYLHSWKSNFVQKYLLAPLPPRVNCCIQNPLVFVFPRTNIPLINKYHRKSRSKVLTLFQQYWWYQYRFW